MKKMMGKTPSSHISCACGGGVPTFIEGKHVATGEWTLDGQKIMAHVYQG